MTNDAASRTLLIVDDDPVFCRTLSRAMRRRGYSVRRTASVAEAQAAIAAETTAYAILELRLPDGSGLDLLESLAAQRRDTRAIILTGYGSVATAVAAARLGVIDYLAKPADADAIDAALRSRARQFGADQTFKRPDEQEFGYLLTMFERYDRNMSETARAIGMHRRTLQRILRRHGIAPGDKVEPVSDHRRMRRMYRLWTRLLDGVDPMPVG